MAVEKHGDNWRVSLGWKGFPRIRLTAGRTKAEALDAERALAALRGAGHDDIITAVADKRVPLARVVAAVRDKGPTALTLDALTDDGGPSTQEAFDAWKDWMRSPGTLSSRQRRTFAPSTIVGYDHDVTEWMEWRAEPRLRKAAVWKPEDYARWLSERGKRDSTINTRFISAMAFLRWASKRYPKVPPPPDWMRRAETKHEDRHAEPEQVEQLLAVASPAEQAWLLLCFDAGLRSGEGAYLRREDVMPGRLRLTSRPAFRLKTPGSARTVPLTARLAALLASLPVEPSGYVLPPRFRSRGGLRQCWLNLVKRSGVEGLSPHSLRHGCAVRMARAGVPVILMMKTLGHGSEKTLARYLVFRPGASDDAVVLAALAAPPQPQSRP